MTTLFQTQRLDSREMEIEEKLLTIHHNLGCKVIPKIRLDPFHEDLDNEPEDGHEDRELWEDQLGIKLAVRMIDNAVSEMAAKLQLCRKGEEKLKIINNQLDKEKENVLRENLEIKNDIISVKEQKTNLDNELVAVKTKFKRLKAEYDKLKQVEDSSSNKRSGGLPLPDAKKMKGLSPVFPQNRSPLSSVPANTIPIPSPVEIDTTPTMPTVKRSRSRVLAGLAGRKSPKGRMGIGFHDDPSFVPETMKIAPSPSLLNPLDTQEVPESPEKHSSQLGCSQSAPPSPVLRNSRGKGLNGPKHQNRNNGPAGDDKDPSKALSTASDPGNKPSSTDLLVSNALRQKISPTVVQTNSNKWDPIEDNSRNRVGRVAPGVQSTIDKKAYQDLDQDFPPKKRPKQSWEPSDQDIVPKKPTFLDDSSSDFESPNLLKKTKKLIDREDEIEDFASPPANDVGEKAKNPEPAKIARTNSASFKKPKIKKVENRWGIEVSELTKSQSKRLKNQKQSKLDNFFGSKAKTNVKRTNTDKEMEQVLKLSKETFELEQKQMSTTSKRTSQNSREPVQQNSREPVHQNPREPDQQNSREPNHQNSRESVQHKSREPVQQNSREPIKQESREPIQHKSREPVSKRSREPVDELDFSPDEAGPSSPNYAYVNAVVRGRDERKKLRGFDCYECEEYYKSKLEEGYSEEQVQKMMNDCSKHRGKYKPPLTPEKFWDPEMIEGDPESPRNKTQVQTKPFNNRARRRALNKEKNKVRKLEKDHVDNDDLIEH